MRSVLIPREHLEVEELPARPLGPALRDKVRALFEAEQRERGGESVLYDGQLFSLETLEPGRLRGRFVAYSEWVAQLREPALRAQLRIRPLGVTGAIVSEGALVFGLRSRESFQHAGLWELAPSGGVDPDAYESDGRVAPERQLLLELEEELGWPAERVVRATPYALVEDPVLEVIDVAYELELEGSARQLEAAIEERASREYEAVERVPLAGVPGFVEREAARMSPVALEMLRARGWLGR